MNCDGKTCQLARPYVHRHVTIIHESLIAVTINASESAGCLEAIGVNSKDVQVRGHSFVTDLLGCNSQTATSATANVYRIAD